MLVTRFSRFLWVYQDEFVWLAVTLDPRSSLKQKEALFANAHKRAAAVIALFESSHDASSLQKFSTLSAFFLDFVTKRNVPLTLREESSCMSVSQSTSSSASSSFSLKFATSSCLSSSSISPALRRSSSLPSSSQDASLTSPQPG